MDDVSGVEAGLDGVMMKIGRNLLLYQRIEQLLKRLVALGQYSLSGSTPEEMKVRIKPTIFTQTLGQIRNTFYENHCTSKGFPPADDEHPGELWAISWHFDFAVPEDFQSDLDRMVADRNRFVHRLNPDLDSPTGRIHAAKALDQEYAAHQPVLVRLQSYYDAVLDDMKEVASFLQTPEGHDAMMIPTYQESPVIHALMNHARNEGAGDDWIPLGDVAKLIRRKSPTMIETELERLGKKTLTELVRASGAFELQPEATPSGGIRLLYRSSGS